MDKLIEIIYKKIFNADYIIRNGLYYNNVLITNNIKLIYEFIGLCNCKEIKSEKDKFDYIIGSHFFNIEFFDNINLINYYQKNPKNRIFIKNKDDEYYIKRIESFFRIFNKDLKIIMVN